jgi:glycosyltransferase involved in cell wall biosynthesis
MNKIGILIPCYNVQVSIQDVLTSLSDKVLINIDTVLAVDNCSNDNTLQVLTEIKSSELIVGKKLVIIKNSQNYGLGGSQKIGYNYFIENGFSHFMIIHGDNQGDANDISRDFLNYFEKDSKIDLIYASRFLKNSNTSQYNIIRRIGNIFFNIVTYILTGYKMSDSGCGIIFYNIDILKRIPFQELTNSSQFNPQLNILIHQLDDLDMAEIPLNWKDSEVESHIEAVKYCWILLKILVNYKFNKTIRRKLGWRLFSQTSQAFKPKIEIISSKINL